MIVFLLLFFALFLIKQTFLYEVNGFPQTSNY